METRRRGKFTGAILSTARAADEAPRAGSAWRAPENQATGRQARASSASSEEGLPLGTGAPRALCSPGCRAQPRRPQVDGPQERPVAAPRPRPERNFATHLSGPTASSPAPAPARAGPRPGSRPAGPAGSRTCLPVAPGARALRPARGGSARPGEAPPRAAARASALRAAHTPPPGAAAARGLYRRELRLRVTLGPRQDAPRLGAGGDAGIALPRFWLCSDAL